METATVKNAQSFGEQMAVLRGQLNGREYMKHVKNLLPALTPWQIRNAVNGRTPNPLVLAAVKIVIHKFEQEHKQALASLEEAGRSIGLAA